MPDSTDYLSLAAKSWSDLTFYYDVRTDRERQLVNLKAVEYAEKASRAGGQEAAAAAAAAEEGGGASAAALRFPGCSARWTVTLLRKSDLLARLPAGRAPAVRSMASPPASCQPPPSPARLRAHLACLQCISAFPEEVVGHVALCVSKGRLALFTDNKTKVRLAKEAQQCAYTAIACDPNNDVAHHLMGRCGGWGRSFRLCGCTAVWLPLLAGRGRPALSSNPFLPFSACFGLCVFAPALARLLSCTCSRAPAPATPCRPYRLADRGSCLLPPPWALQVALRDGADQCCTAHPREGHVWYCLVPGHPPGRPRLLPARSRAGAGAPDPQVCGWWRGRLRLRSAGLLGEVLCGLQHGSAHRLYLYSRIPLLLSCCRVEAGRLHLELGQVEEGVEQLEVGGRVSGCQCMAWPAPAALVGPSGRPSWQLTGAACLVLTHTARNLAAAKCLP